MILQVPAWKLVKYPVVKFDLVALTYAQTNHKLHVAQMYLLYIIPYRLKAG